MTRKLFSVLLLIFITTAQVIAGEDRALFWKVESGDAVVYLLGSIHYADDSFYPLREAIEMAFDEADNLVVEVKMTTSDVVRYQQILASQGMYEGSQTIKDNVSPKTYELLKQRLRELGIPLEYVHRQKPAVIVLTLTSAQVMQLGFDPARGIDAYFLGRSGDAKKVIALETVEQQLGIFLNISNGELLLQESLRSMDEAETLMRDMVAMWKRGDVEAINRLLFEETLREYPSFASIYDSLFYRRNRNMTTAIKKFLESSETFFVVVGAGHLVGERGIVNLLRQAGYSVKRL